MVRRRIDLTREGGEDLQWLAGRLGFPPQVAAEYAVRLVSACIREGLLDGPSASLWPREAQIAARALRSTGTQGKVLRFPDAKERV